MTAPYKKRAKAGYNTDKSISNKSERKFEDIEIKEQQSETTKVTPATEKAKTTKIEKDIKRHLSNLKWAVRNSKGMGLEQLRKKDPSSFMSHYHFELYRDAKIAIPVLQEALNHPELPSKVKKLIRELLDKV